MQATYQSNLLNSKLRLVVIILEEEEGDRKEKRKSLILFIWF